MGDRREIKTGVRKSNALRLAENFHLAAAALSLSLFASGCAQFQEYQPVPISAPGRAQALDARTLDNPRLQMFIAASASTVPPAEWDLGTLTLAALYYHPDIELARSRLAASNAAVITAAQIPNPTGSTDLMLSPFTVSPVIDFLIETFNRREYRTAQAQALVDAAREDLSTAAWQVRGRVRAALLNMWAAQQRSEFLRRRAVLQDQLVGLLERRLAEGEASALDVTRERINRNQLSVAIREADRQSADSQAQLAAAVGVPIQALQGKTFDLTAFDTAQFPEGTLPELRRQALTGRTDIQAALAQYRALESALQLEIAKQYPNVSLGPGYTFEPGPDQYEFTLAAAAELPVFSHNQGPIAEAEARRSGIAAQLDSLQSQTIGAIDAAVTSYRAATASVETVGALLEESRRRNEQIMRSLEAGEADRPTLVSAGIELSIVELARFEASVQQRQSIGALEDALQRRLFDSGTNFALPSADQLLTPESMP